MALTIQELLALRRLCDDSTDPELILEEDELFVMNDGVHAVQILVPGYGRMYVSDFTPASEAESCGTSV